VFAIRLHEFGPPENLVYEEVDPPTPGPREVAIEVAASGVHLVDTAIRRGDQRGPWPLPDLPAIPGREVAGRVIGVGEGVDDRWLGRRVVVHLGLASGGYAERAVADVGSVHEIADGVSEAVAVAMIGTGRTTMGILEVAALRRDDVVLVTAAAGGIGNLLVQEARAVGAVVVGVAGGEDKVRRVKELGADAAVDYNADHWTDELRAAVDRPFTVVFDGVGGALGRGAVDVLGVGGRLVMFGWSAGEPTPISSGLLFERGISATAAIGARMLQRPGGLRELEERAIAAATSGRWLPIVDTRFSLREAAAAHAALESRATMGKVVLIP
jgi:NADPH2:quinone reductase